MYHWFTPRLQRIIDVNITWHPRHPELDVEAYTIGDRREANIEISWQQPLPDLMVTLAHELVHAKQYIRGELSGKHRAWRGKCHVNTQYDQLPWEQEAYQWEQTLYDIYWSKP